MDWKAFLKPDLKRAAFFAVLAVLTFLFGVMAAPAGSTNFGLPLPAIIVGLGSMGTQFYQVWWPNLVLDVIVLYLVACAIAFGLFKNKKAL